MWLGAGEKTASAVECCYLLCVHGVPFVARLSPYFLKARVIKVNELKLLLMTHKIVNRNFPSYLNNLIMFVSGASSRSTRAHKLKLCVFLVGVDAPEGSFSVKSCHLWNNLSEKLCVTQNGNSLKS
jgi:hypothetical protein